jgi:hypothetical protein
MNGEGERMTDNGLPQIRSVLATTPARWTAMTAGMPAALLQRAPAPGEWSAGDCLRHLRDAERDVFQVRVRAFRAGQDLEPYDPDTQGTAGGESPEELAADFARLRQGGLAMLDELTADDLACSAIHGEYGPVQLGQMLNEWAAHDLMHTVQAERALMQPFVAKSGPWRVTFADHDIGG